MRLLVDTQCWLWMESAPKRFSSTTRDLLENPTQELFLSAAACWEIAIKYRLGKLPLPMSPRRYVVSRLARGAVTALDIEPRHALETARLPDFHRDPFDRLMIATARLEGMTILTADTQFAAYDVALMSP